MTTKETSLKGCYILQPNVFTDHRGVFFESFNKKKFEEIIGQKINFVQDNQSISSRGVLRGLHFQKNSHAQAKLMRVVKGSVQDVIVDLRPKSQTFGKYFSTILSADNNQQLFIPRGFAHGFLTLEDDTIFSYKCDNFYNKESESGILYCDKTLSIKWELENEEYILSDKDLNLPKFNDLDL